jgi:hypothetical protein
MKLSVTNTEDPGINGDTRSEAWVYLRGMIFLVAGGRYEGFPGLGVGGRLPGFRSSESVHYLHLSEPSTLRPLLSGTE